ncbi:MAG: hypothetical protein EFT35_01985 [Methanophagales archaeon ANME-1-THS]|nr:MAG: hypothetical protein EFT35_01985 [Methanophagales archaeon ANME-1-THS]
MGELSYLITLKYIKPSKQGKSKLAEFLPLIPLNNSEHNGRGAVEVRARVFIPEFTNFTKKLGFENRGNKRKVLRTDDGESYLRVFVYAVVRQSIRSEAKVEKLKRIIVDLPLADIRYWASIFRDTYEKYRTRGSLKKPARGFREVYDLG